MRYFVIFWVTKILMRPILNVHSGRILPAGFPPLDYEMFEMTETWKSCEFTKGTTTQDH